MADDALLPAAMKEDAHISRSEAIRIAKEILDKAEKDRLVAAEFEAERGNGG